VRSFQINSKYTFFCLSLILFIAWVYLLLRGAGGRDPENPSRRLPSTPEQVWLTVLGAWLIWANDPFAAVSLTAPSFAASGFYAFCATTFLVLLLLYWMVRACSREDVAMHSPPTAPHVALPTSHDAPASARPPAPPPALPLPSARQVIFDLARDPARTGTPAALQPLGATAQLAKRCSCGAFSAAVLFWAPKLVWSLVTWMLVLTFYLVQRAAQLSDPTFNLLSAVPLLQRYFFTFTATWAALYVIYVALLLLSGLYQCRVIAPTSRYILFITIVTLAACLAGLFLQGVLPVTATNSSVVFMTAQGAANVYIYFLMIAYAPALAHSAVEAARAQDADEAAAAARGGSALTIYGGLPDAPPPKLKALSEAYSQTDESALQPGDGHGDCITMPITIVGADFAPAPPQLPDSPPPGMNASGVGGAFSFGASAVAAPPRAGAARGAAPEAASDDGAMPGAASDSGGGVWK
jgi:hypothetical protein